MALNGVITLTFRFFLRKSVAFGVHYVNLVEDRSIAYFLRQKCRPKNLVLAIYHLWRYSQGITPSESVKVRHYPVASENLTNNQP